MSLFFAACEPAHSDVPSPPAASVLDKVGILVGIDSADLRTHFRLADGTDWEVDNSTVRTVLPRMGDETLFVAGHNQAGPWVALFAHQAETPPGRDVTSLPGT